MLEKLVQIVESVELMGGDPVSEILAPSEIRAIAEALLDAGFQLSADGAGAGATPSWLAAIPPHMRDCFHA
ncbi:hypothetical protein [Sphingomonas sp. IW22]|jgi:hypothetical protein|uniref:hypothetical protein n=1 Tax=Sphingomonas sp. IW22 TaxID=3242489 RepID=UPI003522ABD6